jgi:hypothetical protein
MLLCYVHWSDVYFVRHASQASRPQQPLHIHHTSWQPGVGKCLCHFMSPISVTYVSHRAQRAALKRKFLFPLLV